MIADEELARAVEGRPHWLAGEQVAVFQPPGTAGYVKVRRIAQPVKASQRYVVSTIQGGRATHVVPAGTAVEAIRLAESRAVS